jgi:hypothetical protein
MHSVFASIVLFLILLHFLFLFHDASSDTLVILWRMEKLLAIEVYDISICLYNKINLEPPQIGLPASGLRVELCKSCV